jgi:O-acetyl-ADP-ribose deacetylase (regulator of RNase III)
MMPIVEKPAADILMFKPAVNAFVNPVNCAGAMGAGLALALREHFGEAMHKEYQAKCASKELHIGSLHVWTEEQTSVELINLPTKIHWADPSELEYMKAGLAALRNYLLDRPYHVIVMPMLGCGLGMPQEFTDEQKAERIAEITRMNYDYLDDLPNVIIVSRWPRDFIKADGDHTPKYLAIVGSRWLNDRDYVEARVERTLSHWGLTWKDFAAIVSGGADGVDTIACGKNMQDETYLTSLAAKHGVKAVIAQAHWTRYSRAAGFRRNVTMGAILTHAVALIDERKKKSVGTRMMVGLIKSWNEKHPDEQKPFMGYSYSEDWRTKADIAA